MIDMDNLLEGILEAFSGIDYIHSADIPNIDLYMDQVTSFMETHLQATKRNPEDKVLTKTMINNYAKNDLLPAPIKKKYSKEHLLILIFIYYFKNILSMKDIELLLKPLMERYFHAEEGLTISRIYDEICAFGMERTKQIKQDIESGFHDSLRVFSDFEGENRETLHLFTFICSLGFDVYVKKLLIEKILDRMNAPSDAPEKTSADDSGEKGKQKEGGKDKGRDKDKDKNKDKDKDKHKDKNKKD